MSVTRWRARLALTVAMAMTCALVAVVGAEGQTAPAPLLTIGVDVTSAGASQVTYEFLVKNQGAGQAAGVRVNSDVPANATFESSDPEPAPPASPGPATCDNAGTREGTGTKCEWDLGTMASGESKTIAATYNLSQADVDSYVVALTAQVKSSTDGATDSDTDDSLHRGRFAVEDDTFVNDGDPAGTVHGTCPQLRVRKDNLTTSFIDFTGLPAESAIEMLYAAQMRLTVEFTEYSQATPGFVGAHRITSGDWTEGAGGCTNDTTSTTTTDARTGGDPVSNSTATATAQVTAAEQPVNWDVTTDLDTTDDRSSFQGWELRDAGSPAIGVGANDFDSSESATASQVPHLFLVYEAPESASCVDADPETATRNPSETHRLDAYVTDGKKVGTTPDACDGTPIVGKQLIWTIEDDDPDIWISSADGAATTKTVGGSGDAQPNTVNTTTGSTGKTFVEVKLDDPGNSAANTGEDRISARIEGTDDVKEMGSDPLCGVTVQCPGEADNEDDVKVTWDPAATPSPSDSPSTSASPSESPTNSPTETSSPTPTPTESQGGERTITLEASKGKVEWNDSVALSGSIQTQQLNCCDEGEFVRIQRRTFGTTHFKGLTTTATDATGKYTIDVVVKASAEYRAIAPAHDECQEAMSEPVTVLGKAKVAAKASDTSPKKGSLFHITGSVKPNHRGTKVTLRFMKGKKFVKVAAVKLSKRSTFDFEVRADWSGGARIFKVTWPGDQDHARASSKKITVKPS